jgi:hypothetical protein
LELGVGPLAGDHVRYAGAAVLKPSLKISKLLCARGDTPFQLGVPSIQALDRIEKIRLDAGEEADPG